MYAITKVTQDLLKIFPRERCFILKRETTPRHLFKRIKSLPKEQQRDYSERFKRRNNSYHLNLLWAEVFACRLELRESVNSPDRIRFWLTRWPSDKEYFRDKIWNAKQALEWVNRVDSSDLNYFLKKFEKRRGPYMKALKKRAKEQSKVLNFTLHYGEPYLVPLDSTYSLSYPPGGSQ